MSKMRKMSKMSKDMVKKLAILLSIIVIVTVVFYEKEKIMRAYGLTEYAEHLQHWIAQHKPSSWSFFGGNPNKTMVASKAETKPPIHFEFYTMLPAMQVKVPISQVQALPLPPVQTLPSPLSASSPPKQMKTAKIFDAETIAAGFHAELRDTAKVVHYAIQLGFFKNAATAEHYRLSLLKLGIKAKVVKTTVSGKKGYRVQVGPFQNEEQMRLTQRKLRRETLYQ